MSIPKTLLAMLLLSIFCQAAYADIESDLYGLWHLEGDKVDVSGNARTLSSVGTIAVSANGHQGQCYLLDNTNVAARQMLYYNVSIAETSELSFAGWINPSSLASGTGASAPPTIVHFYKVSSTNDLRLVINDGNLAVRYSGDAVSTSTVSTVLAIPTNQWTFVGVTVSSTTLTIYKNNETPVSVAVSNTQSYNRMFWGLLENTSTAPRGFNGWMDELRVYTRELEPGEVAALYNLEFDPNLFGKWGLNGNLGDSGGYNHDLSSYGTNVVPVADGQIGTSYQLTNTDPNSRSMVYYNASIPATKEVTFAGWVRPMVLANGETTTAPHTIMHLYKLSTAQSLDLRIKDGKLNLAYNLASGEVDTGWSIPTNAWSFVALTVTATGGKIFLNNETPVSYSATGLQDYNRLFFGLSENAATAPRGLTGNIDELRLYTTSLSDPQISAIYALEVPVELSKFDTE